jgi:hypothetical protein
VSVARAGGPAPEWASLPPRALAEYIAAQRWGGARGTTLEGVRVAAAVPVPLPDGAPCAVLVVEGRAGGAAVRWQLPLVAGAGAGEAVAAVDGVALRDATAHAPFRDAVRSAGGPPAARRRRGARAASAPTRASTARSPRASARRSRATRPSCTATRPS